MSEAVVVCVIILAALSPLCASIGKEMSSVVAAF